MRLKELIPILPMSFIVYDMTHSRIFNVAYYRMLYLPKHAHYLEYHVYLIKSSDKHIVINIMED